MSSLVDAVEVLERPSVAPPSLEARHGEPPAARGAPERSSARGNVLEALLLGGVLLLSALLNLVGLDREGFGNTYYAAAVWSMLQNWHAFLFNSFDAGGFVTVDKPPLGLWLQVLSARLLGFNGVALLLPQALAGVAAVGVLYLLVRRTFGRWRGAGRGARAGGYADQRRHRPQQHDGRAAGTDPPARGLADEPGRGARRRSSAARRGGPGRAGIQREDAPGLSGRARLRTRLRALGADLTLATFSPPARGWPGARRRLARLVRDGRRDAERAAPLHRLEWQQLGIEPGARLQRSESADARHRPARTRAQRARNHGRLERGTGSGAGHRQSWRVSPARPDPRRSGELVIAPGPGWSGARLLAGFSVRRPTASRQIPASCDASGSDWWSGAAGWWPGG